MSWKEFFNEIKDLCNYNDICEEVLSEKIQKLKHHWKNGRMSVDDVFDLVFEEYL